MLLATLDSDADLVAMTTIRSLMERHPGCWFLGTGLVLSGRVLVQVANDFAIFDGFDEIWRFAAEPRIAKPASVSLLSPQDLETEDVRDLLGWMTDYGCTLGLGDGVGLNYAVRADAMPDAAKRLSRLPTD